MTGPSALRASINARGTDAAASLSVVIWRGLGLLARFALGALGRDLLQQRRDPFLPLHVLVVVEADLGRPPHVHVFGEPPAHERGGALERARRLAPLRLV